MQAAQVFALTLSLIDFISRIRRAYSLVKSTWKETGDTLENVRAIYEKAHPIKS